MGTNSASNGHQKSHSSSNYSSFNKDNGGGYFPKGTAPSSHPDYSTWTWKQIEAAIVGGSQIPPDGGGSATAKSYADPNTLYQAADGFNFVMHTLLVVSQSILDQAFALASGNTPPWKGQAADAFYDTMTVFSQQVSANANVLQGTTSSGGSVPQQIADQGYNLAVAQAKIEAIDSWYATQAAKTLKAESNGLIPVSDIQGLPEKITETMLPVLQGLVAEYEVTINAISPVSPSFTNLGNGSGNPSPNSHNSANSPPPNLHLNDPPPPSSLPNGANNVPKPSDLHVPGGSSVNKPSLPGGSSGIHAPGGSLGLPRSLSPNTVPPPLSAGGLGGAGGIAPFPGAASADPGGAPVLPPGIPGDGGGIPALPSDDLANIPDDLGDAQLPDEGGMPDDLGDLAGDNLPDPALGNLAADPFDGASLPSGVGGAAPAEQDSGLGEMPFLPGMGGLGQQAGGPERSDASGLLGGEDEPWLEQDLADIIAAGVAAGGVALAGLPVGAAAERPAQEEQEESVAAERPGADEDSPAENGQIVADDTGQPAPVYRDVAPEAGEAGEGRSAALGPERPLTGAARPDEQVRSAVRISAPPGETTEDFAAWDDVVAGAALLTAVTRGGEAGDRSDDPELARWRRVRAASSGSPAEVAEPEFRLSGAGRSPVAGQADERTAEDESADSDEEAGDETQGAAALLVEDTSLWGAWRSDPGALG
ncbi:MAG TPA: hypothetical protein VIZ43_16985 [Trebonia sp.]